jgi:hypothetical protein
MPDPEAVREDAGHSPSAVEMPGPPTVVITVAAARQPVVEVPRRTEADEAPGSQGTRSEDTRQYLSDEPRGEAGCVVGRMQRTSTPGC